MIRRGVLKPREASAAKGRPGPGTIGVLFTLAYLAVLLVFGADRSDAPLSYRGSDDPLISVTDMDFEVQDGVFIANLTLENRLDRPLMSLGSRNYIVLRAFYHGFTVDPEGTLHASSSDYIATGLTAPPLENAQNLNTTIDLYASGLGRRSDVQASWASGGERTFRLHFSVIDPGEEHYNHTIEYHGLEFMMMNLGDRNLHWFSGCFNQQVEPFFGISEAGHECWWWDKYGRLWPE